MTEAKLKAIICAGAPASGKSTWAEKLHDQHWEGGVGFTWVWIEADRIREQLFKIPEYAALGSMHHKAIHKRTFEVHEQLLHSAMKGGKNIVISDTNLNKRFRDQLVTRLEQAGYDVELKMFPCDLETLLERNSLREGDRRVPDDVVRRYHDLFVSQFGKVEE